MELSFIAQNCFRSTRCEDLWDAMKARWRDAAESRIRHCRVCFGSNHSIGIHEVVWQFYNVDRHTWHLQIHSSELKLSVVPKDLFYFSNVIEGTIRLAFS